MLMLSSLLHLAMRSNIRKPYSSCAVIFMMKSPNPEGGKGKNFYVIKYAPNPEGEQGQVLLYDEIIFTKKPFLFKIL
jgi:hypothetical protein